MLIFCETEHFLNVALTIWAWSLILMLLQQRSQIHQESALVIIGAENARSNHFPNSNTKWHKPMKTYVCQAAQNLPLVH